MAATAYLGIGANLGDRLANLREAVRGLAAQTGVRLVRSSRIYETEPVGGPPQPRFLNAVLEISTDLDPHELLGACARVEVSLGRERRERWGPRTIDIDLLVYDELEIDEPDLVVPHPRMHERGFVLVPLTELVADPPLPGGRRLATLRADHGLLAGVVAFGPPLEVRA